MVIKRDILLNKLIQAKNHNLIKILVGIRRCGKSFLLFNLFKQHLLGTGVWNIPDSEKREQETFSLRHIGDNFRKMVITGDPYEKPWTDRNCVTFIGIVPFLLDPHSLETL